MAYIQQTKTFQRLFFLSVFLILLGLFLPWYAVGDLISVNIQPLVLKWNTIFTQTGERLFLPSLEQNIPNGLILLFGVICLIILRFGRVSIQIIKWTTLGAALILLSLSSYYIVSIWQIYILGEKIGRTPPGFGLYIFFLGSVILFFASLRVESKKSS
jgi:hypothetical protein